MDKYVCIHGHFYQPPRENPWLEDVELQDSAYPYHNWNEKITEECYRQNSASRILGPDRKIIDIVNNYSRISFDFGPTLLFWMERHFPEVYESIVEADKESCGNFSGHGAAIAQVYNHIIMPLASRRDKCTQVKWGMYDFEHRFGRKPEGMWLPETAVDMETLEVFAEHNIKFTILAPHQAKRFRRIGEKEWINLELDKVDTTAAYLCRLASGKTINLFFYHQPTAQDVADGRILQNGEVFARRLARILEKDDEQAGLAHIATDGETYGHHYRHTDMALAYCLHFIETHNLAKITVYGEYLEKFPPKYEVEIYENSSWSCNHGIERWRGNCGCHYGRYPSGNQQWRAPLREAMDWLRDELALVYERRMTEYIPEPWQARDKYISVINDRAAENVEAFLLQVCGKKLSYDEKVLILKLLEMQRNAMLMYTSCGWFFDDISGIEAVQIMQYAARAIQLAKEVDNKDFEPGFKEILQKAPTNVKDFGNGKDVYDVLVKPANVDLNRVGAHLALSSIFEDYSDEKDIYCYRTEVETYDRVDAGIQVLATGRATIRSNIVLESHDVDFAVLHLGDHNLICAVNARSADKDFSKMREDLKNAFSKGDTTEVMRVMNIFFKGNNYSLWHLFKDQQRRILYELLETTWQEIEASFRHIYEHNYTIMQIMRGMHIPLPKALSGPAEFILNQDLCRVMRCDEVDVERLRKLADEAAKLSLQLDTATLRFEASRKINALMGRLEDSPDDAELLEKISAVLAVLLSIIPELDLQFAQNVLFGISRERYPAMIQKLNSGEELAKRWCGHFKTLANYLGVKIE
jgi:alpha-amylase/alpha-mannosidase (GH57 family)